MQKGVIDLSTKIKVGTILTYAERRRVVLTEVSKNKVLHILVRGVDMDTGELVKYDRKNLEAVIKSGRVRIETVTVNQSGVVAGRAVNPQQLLSLEVRVLPTPPGNNLLRQ